MCIKAIFIPFTTCEYVRSKNTRRVRETCCLERFSSILMKGVRSSVVTNKPLFILNNEEDKNLNSSFEKNSSFPPAQRDLRDLNFLQPPLALPTQLTLYVRLKLIVVQIYKSILDFYLSKVENPPFLFGGAGAE